MSIIRIARVCSFDIVKVLSGVRSNARFSASAHGRSSSEASDRTRLGVQNTGSDTATKRGKEREQGGKRARENERASKRERKRDREERKETEKGEREGVNGYKH